jgi:hypothetical protein
MTALLRLLKKYLAGTVTVIAVVRSTIRGGVLLQVRKTH